MTSINWSAQQYRWPLKHVQTQVHLPAIRLGSGEPRVAPNIAKVSATLLQALGQYLIEKLEKFNLA
jgi:hypothetical protein